MGLWEKVAEFLKGATNVSQADAVATMPTPGIPETVAQGMAADFRKNEQPVLTPPANPVTK